MASKKYIFQFTLADGTTHSIPIEIPVGEPGGYYIPTLRQVSDTEIEVSYTPSNPGMPSVKPVIIDVDLTGYATEDWVQEGYQPNGDYLASSELPAAINTALAQAKASGEFDGQPGEKGDKGDKGDTGENGKTPMKGVDYFTSADKADFVNSVLDALPTWTGGSY